MKKILLIVLLLAACAPVLADGGEQVYPNPPYKIIQVRWRLRGNLIYYGFPTGRYATEVFASQSRYVYWQNTNGEYRWFKLPGGYSVWLTWKERTFTRRFFWWGSYEYRWRSQLVLGPS